MDIADIIAADQAARRQVEAARAAADEIDGNIPAETQALREELYRQAREKVEAFQAQQDQTVATRTAQTEQQTEERMQRLDESAAQHADEWLHHIVSKVTEV